MLTHDYVEDIQSSIEGILDSSRLELNASLPLCRQCGGSRTVNRGALPKGRKFAGQKLTPVLAGGHLYECAGCSLVFRHPVLQEAEYEALYETVSGEFWESDGLRGDQWQIHHAIKQRYSGGKLLDVGCYDGALAASLGDSFEKFGIEASQAAASVAEKRGVRILAAKIRELERLPGTEYDVITAVDVIEHVHDPKALLKVLASKLKPGGALIISTGNAYAHAWRALGARYWYCALPDHISFISPQWSRQVAEELGLELQQVTEFRYNPSHGRRALYEWLELPIKWCISAFEMLVMRWLSPAARRLGPRLCLGRHGMFKDHFLAIFIKL